MSGPDEGRELARRPVQARRTVAAPAHHAPLAPAEVGRARGAQTLLYRAVEHHWSLRWPCAVCGGVELPLRGHAIVPEPDRPLARDPNDRPCPGCESRRKRLEPAGGAPAVWYDASLRDWVVRLPCSGSGDGGVLPLEIPWFDAPWAEVYRAAADIAYAGDVFEA